MIESIHPATDTNNIPFSLELRIVRTCTNIIDRDNRMDELKEMLISRDYPDRLIDSAIRRALSISRNKALQSKKQKENTKKTIICNKI